MDVLEDQLIDAAVHRGLVDRQLADEVRKKSSNRKKCLRLLMFGGRFSLSKAYRALAERRGQTFVDLNEVQSQADLIQKLGPGFMKSRRLLPFLQEGSERVWVATVETKHDAQTHRQIQQKIGNYEIYVADPFTLSASIDRVLVEALGEERAPAASEPDAGPLLDQIFEEAYLRRATDVHVEPMRRGVRVRMRVDGKLEIYLSGLSPKTGEALISIIKIQAKMDTAEQRSSQDGRFTYRPENRLFPGFDIRVATIVIRWGEKATMRLLGVDTEDLLLNDLGVPENEQEAFKQAIREPHGMILVTGPTGSGKSTTLHAALRELNQTNRNIMTVEDPVEYLIDGASQITVRGANRVGSFADVLRALLRHDPDILMVGEIRDRETADVAIRAAMTGHLLFSTLHTNSACGAITRLRDMGCESYLLGSTLIGVIAQRLVRRLCESCKTVDRIDKSRAAQLGLPDTAATIYKPQGCALCDGRGYRGRIGIFECLWLDQELIGLIHEDASQAKIEEVASDRMTTLRGHAMRRVINGETSVEEMVSVAGLKG